MSEKHNKQKSAEQAAHSDIPEEETVNAENADGLSEAEEKELPETEPQPEAKEPTELEKAQASGIRLPPSTTTTASAPRLRRLRLMPTARRKQF